MSEKIYLPTLEESVKALQVAAEVRTVVDQFASTGKCRGHTLIGLASALYELESHLLGRAGAMNAEAVWERWEQLEELLHDKAKHPELSTYSNYYVEYHEPGEPGTVHRFERDPESEEIV